jgi:uncharacterized protein (DUF488 family)
MLDDLKVLTIGHSTHSWERFISLLRSSGISAVADVRSSPYSRFNARFNRDELRQELRSDGIYYVFMGNELGGRPKEHKLYCEGVADYEKMAQTDEFRKGLDRVVEGAKKHRIALMCSERDPLDCHRCLLVSRALAQRGVTVDHILDGGRTVSHSKLEDELLEVSGRGAGDLFAQREDQLAAAYRERAKRVAFTKPQLDSDGTIAAE